MALAREILGRYGKLTTGPRIAFFEALSSRFGVDPARMEQAIAAWRDKPCDGTAVDVHAAQWGTLGRVIAAVRAGAVASAIAIDEDTMVVVEGGVARVAGLGFVHSVTVAGSVAHVRSFRAGETLE